MIAMKIDIIWFTLIKFQEKESSYSKSHKKKTYIFKPPKHPKPMVIVPYTNFSHFFSLISLPTSNPTYTQSTIWKRKFMVLIYIEKIPNDFINYIQINVVFEFVLLKYVFL